MNDSLLVITILACPVLAIFCVALLISRLLERLAERRARRIAPPPERTEVRHVQKVFPVQRVARALQPKTAPKAAETPAPGGVEPLPVKVYYRREEWETSSPVRVLTPKSLWN